MHQLHVEIFADIICPWCFIGKRRLEQSFAMRPDIEPIYHWRGFLLNPAMPIEGMDRQDYLHAKFGSAAQSVYSRISEAGEEAGVRFALDDIAVTPDSRPIHRLMISADAMSFALSESFYRAYFQEGADISDREIQARLCAENGLDIAELEASEKTATTQLEADLQQGQDFGIDGVPFIVFAGQFSISGAHRPEILLNVIDAAVQAV